MLLRVRKEVAQLEGQGQLGVGYDRVNSGSHVKDGPLLGGDGMDNIDEKIRKYFG